LLRSSAGDMALSATWGIVKETVREFVDDDAMTAGAALAFFTALGMSPILVLLLWIATFAGPHTQEQLLIQLQSLVGSEAGRAVEAVVDNAEATPGLGTLAGIVSLVTLLCSVSGVFAHLQAALNRMWDVKAAPEQTGVWPWVRKRLLSMGMFIGTGFLLVVSLAVTTVVQAANERAHDVLPGGDAIWAAVGSLLSLLVSALFFALIFKVLPDVKLRWRDVGFGGLATAILFSIGRWLIGVYLGRSSVGSAYGAAGSLVVLLVWVYYASLVVFLGAELTQVLARRFGKTVEPEALAVSVERHESVKPATRPARR
jgi:membrane protein